MNVTSILQALPVQVDWVGLQNQVHAHYVNLQSRFESEALPVILPYYNKAHKEVTEYFKDYQLHEIVVLILITYIIARIVTAVLTAVIKHGPKGAAMWYGIKFLKMVPFGRRQLDKELNKSKAKMEDALLNKFDLGEPNFALPDRGMPEDRLFDMLEGWKKKEQELWGTGKVSGGIYHGDLQFKELLNRAYSMFSLDNPLHADLFPYARKMEAEVVRMTLSLFHPTPTCCGTMTSGGTESILMAIKSYREIAKARGVTKPELVVPISAHAAFDKAADYFCIKIVHVPVDPKTFRADVRAMAKHINKNTIALVGSAPGFPHGVVDPIEDLAKLAKKWNIGLHVDCCLGSFLLPTIAEMGYPVPKFDFGVDGVTSISCDTHKFGFAPKGSSVIMYSSPDIRQHQYFVQPNWPGGLYASPTIAGSRSGGIIAAAWAALMLLGKDGYRKIAKDIMDTRKQIIDGLRKMPELRICGEPQASVVALESSDKSLDIYKVSEAMNNRGWHLNNLQFPRSFHLCVTNMQVGRGDVFLKELRESIDEVVNNPKKFQDGAAVVYGMAEALPDRSMVSDMAKIFLDTLYTVKASVVGKKTKGGH